MGFDDGAHFFDCRVELGLFLDPEAHFALMGSRRIDAEITQGLALDAAIRHDNLDLVIGHQLGLE